MIQTTLPPNKYYIGDPCYVLSDDVYDNVFGPLYNKGIYEHNGHKFAIGATACGDGIFKDNKKRRYCVDAGVLSIIPYELCEKENDCKEMNKLGKVFTFTNEVNVTFHNGVFEFKSAPDVNICIKT